MYSLSGDIRSGHRLFPIFFSIQSAEGRLNVNRRRDSVGAFSYLRPPNRNRSSFDHMPFEEKARMMTSVIDGMRFECGRVSERTEGPKKRRQREGDLLMRHIIDLAVPPPLWLLKKEIVG
jgi:hypothetical protein